MAHLGYGLHRHHKRREEQEEGPKARLLDKIVYVVVFSGIVLTIPQIANVWLLHDVSGLSLVSWATYAVVSTFWFIYGLVHKERLVTVSSFVWIILHTMVVVGILVFG